MYCLYLEGRLWRWSQHVPQKYRYTPARLCGVTSKKMVIFIVIAMSIHKHNIPCWPHSATDIPQMFIQEISSNAHQDRHMRSLIEKRKGLCRILLPCINCFISNISSEIYSAMWSVFCTSAVKPLIYKLLCHEYVMEHTYLLLVY
jgi:hypothetical protein